MLKIKNMNLNNVIRQGDTKPRQYQLDTGNLDLNLTNKSATIRLMTADFQGIGYETTATVSSDNKISFSIDDVIPARQYRLEVTVDDYVFPSRATDGQFNIDPSSHGQEVNIIQIIGKEEIVRDVKARVENELEPFLGEIEQAELDRQAQEEARVGAESTRETNEQTRLNKDRLRDDKIAQMEADKDAVIANVTVDSEVILARGGKATLGQRLDETTTQFAQKTTKGQVNINHFDEATRQTFLEAQGIDVNYVLGDKNVLPKNTTFFQVEKNMFNKDAVTPNATIESTNGNLTIGRDGYYASEYILVEPNTTYTRSRGWTLAIYNSNKTFIEGSPSSQNGRLTFTTPEDARYVRVSLLESDLDILQLEKGSSPSDYEPYRTFIEEKYLEKRIITPVDTSFFEVGKNLFNKNNVILDMTVNSSDGRELTFSETALTDFMPIEGNTTYSRTHGHTMAFYTRDKLFISGIGWKDRGPLTFTTPGEAAYMKISVQKTLLDVVQVEKGEYQTEYDPYRLVLKKEHTNLIESRDIAFKASFTTNLVPENIMNKHTGNLSLISKKTIQHGNTPPDVIGYLYLDEETQKVYYSAGNADNPEFLFDWQPSLSEGQPCEVHNAFITQDGDIIFMRNRLRRNPVMYPAGDYGNPVVINFGSRLKPYAFETDAGIDIHPSGDYFIFGEYTGHSQSDEDNNDPRNIWKVTKPFSDPNNWKVKHSFKHVYFQSPESNEPDNEIGHIHTAIRDFYTNNWYVSTGDINRHCRVWESEDDGETWHEVARDKEAIDTTGVWQSVADNGQAWRAFGMIYTEDAAYWGTDAHGVNVHRLYKVHRDSNGKLDFSTLEPLANLDLVNGQRQPTYTTCYVREPNGLLFLDRAEPRSDHKLDLLFWSFEYERLFKLGTYDRIPNEDSANRSGWGNQVASFYQPTNEDGIVLGASSHIRRNKMDVLNNRIDNRVGNIKIRIYEV